MARPELADGLAQLRGRRAPTDKETHLLVPDPICNGDEILRCPQDDEERAGSDCRLYYLGHNDTLVIDIGMAISHVGGMSIGPTIARQVAMANPPGWAVKLARGLIARTSVRRAIARRFAGSDANPTTGGSTFAETQVSRAPQKMQKMQKIESPAENGHRIDAGAVGQKMQQMQKIRSGREARRNRRNRRNPRNP